MPQECDILAFQDAVVQELVVLQRRQPEWSSRVPYADPLWPMEALERREAERLARLGRAERGVWRERTRERVAREQARPWREQDRWGLRKRVWMERGDHERELLERRERALLERDEEVSEQFARHAQWLDELRTLEPTARAWCDALAVCIERQETTVADLDELWQRRKSAAERRAAELLADQNLRADLARVVSRPRDVAALAKAITPVLAERATAGYLPLLAVLFAAIAIAIDHMNRTGLRAEERR